MVMEGNAMVDAGVLREWLLVVARARRALEAEVTPGSIEADEALAQLVEEMTAALDDA